MSVQFSKKVLISFYCILTCVYLFASINNALDNFTGNRTIGAILAFVYFAVISFGLLNKPRIFSTVSLFNFIIGSLLFVAIIVAGLPSFKFELLGYVLFGILGSYLSIKSMNANRGL